MGRTGVILGRKQGWGGREYGRKEYGALGTPRHTILHLHPQATTFLSPPGGIYLISWGWSHAETTRRGLSGAVLAHLGEFRLEPREIRRLGCLSAWGGVAFPRCAHPSGRRPTNRQTGSERNSKAGSDQARMRCRTHFESKVKPRDMHWALPVPDTRGVRMASRTVNAKRNRTVWGSMLRRV